MSLFAQMGALEARNARRDGSVSATDLVSDALQRIDTLDPTLHAFARITPEEALARAAAMDRGLIEPGVLWGLPFADKDLTHRRGVVTGAGSKTRLDAEPEAMSDPIAGAIDRAGGISVGKTAVCEFGFASYTESDVLEPTLNPYALERGAGGSSGGAACAVASGMLPLAPGSDGGGSVRIPAWACGVVGHKPSRGLIPAGTGFESPGGLVVPGPLGRSVADAALLLDAMVGDGVTHRATSPGPIVPSFLERLGHAPGPLRIGVTTASPWDDWTDIRIAQPALDALSRIEAVAGGLGHHLERYAWRPPAGYAGAFHVLWSASAVSLDIPPDRLDQLEPLTRYLVEQGRRVSAREFAAALRTLAAFEREVIAQFADYDVVVTPGLAALPPEVGFYDREDPERNFRQQVQVTPFTSFVNVCGLPALALPVGTHQGVPVGVQLVGRPGGDGVVLQLAAQLEAELGFVGIRPPVW